MQPLHKEPVSLAGLLRSYTAELLNTGFPDEYSLNIVITPMAETIFFPCDARLISRAVGNLVQNSISHNPDGCDIALALDCTDSKAFPSPYQIMALACQPRIERTK